MSKVSSNQTAKAPNGHGTAPASAVMPGISPIPIEHRKALYWAFLDEWRHEADVFRDQCCERHADLEASGATRAMINESFETLAEAEQECLIAAFLQSGITPILLISYMDAFKVATDKHFGKLETAEVLYRAVFNEKTVTASKGA